jgi:hypothetical protein
VTVGLVDVGQEYRLIRQHVTDFLRDTLSPYLALTVKRSPFSFP